MFRRSFALILVLAVVCSLIGCDSNNQTSSDSYNYLTDAQIANTLDIGNVNIAKSENGYYVLVGSKLYFVDGVSLGATLLCSKPNCLHSDENCSAVIGNVDNIAFSDGFVYYIASAGVEKEFIGSYLVKLSADGSTKENIYYIDKDYGDFIVHRGYFYYTTREFKLDDYTGLLDIDKCDAYIYRLPLESKDKESEKVYFAEEVERDAQLSGLMAYGDNLYFDLYGMKRGTKNEEIRKSIKLNLTTFEESETITESGVSLSRPRLFGDSLVFTSDENENGKCYYYKTDFNGNNPEKFFETYDGESVFCDGKYLYVDNFYTLVMPHLFEENDEVKTDERYIKVYDSKLNLLDEFSFGSGSATTWHILSVDSEMFLFGGKGNEGDIIFYYDKSEFGNLNGKEWIKKFSYKENNE
ncbi:MAG: hypothetical protein IJ298_06465 [Ruminococcus sp.]|nr:hypothetical protein [Ruminococcus sp.]